MKLDGRQAAMHALIVLASCWLTPSLSARSATESLQEPSNEDERMRSDDASIGDRKSSNEDERMRSGDATTNTPSVVKVRTPEGCVCKSQPKTSKRDYYGCEWCYTEGKCGKRSISGNWDHCIYPVEESYEDQDHNAKLEMLWSEVMRTAGKSAKQRSLRGMVLAIMRTSMRPVFDNNRDVNPPGRGKVVHTQGVHCKFDLAVTPESPFTGLFGPGTHQGLMRIANAASIDNTKSAGNPMNPGVALKFLRSGVQSSNFLAIRGHDQRGSYNFFDSPFTNHVVPPDALKLLKKFSQASACQSMVGLSDLCSRSQDGNPVDKPIFPYEIRLASEGSIVFPDNETMSDADLLEQLESIPSGTVLFKVYGVDSPASSTSILIGELKTTSACVTSSFGDEELSFRHQRMEEDFMLRPEWVPKVSFDSCDASAVSKAGGTTKRWKCPGAP